MSNVAFALVADEHLLISVEDIMTGKINEADIKQIYCLDCKQPLHIVHCEDRCSHFRGKHLSTCLAVNDGRDHKTYKVATDVVIDDLDAILSHKDSAPSTSPTPPPPIPPVVTPGEGIKSDIDDIDAVLIPDVKTIHTLSGIYAYLRGNGIDADMGDGHTGRDYLLLPPLMSKLRSLGDLGVRIAVTRRVSPSEVPLEIPRGYICLCDAFSIAPDTFYLVRLVHPEQHREFRRKIVGTDSYRTRDPHRNILLLGKWRRYKTSAAYVYIADINSHCVYFVNYNL